jgi:hypothetical protein
MEALSLFNCGHQFSWPRRSDSGGHYQVCLVCGKEYQYDWKTMRRTEPLRHGAGRADTTRHEGSHHDGLHDGLHIEDSRRRRGETQTSARARSHRSWRPRERRVRYDLPLRYRVTGTLLWMEGTVENISRSGVLFRCQQPLGRGQHVEMIFEMPAEISGQPHSRVVCSGRVARAMSGESDGGARLAATIEDYRFLQKLA